MAPLLFSSAEAYRGVVTEVSAWGNTEDALSTKYRYSELKRPTIIFCHIRSEYKKKFWLPAVQKFAKIVKFYNLHSIHTTSYSKAKLQIYSI